MAGTAPATAQPELARLDWESNHFGVSAARLVSAELTDEALSAMLQLARRQRIQLLVWPATTGQDVSRELLDEFNGALVDRKATFSKTLPGVNPRGEPPRPTDPPVIEYTSPTVSSALSELAVAAGAYSRFRVDPRIPQERFEAMYRVWIERSVAGELADVVLVVPVDQKRDRTEQLSGMISLSQSGGVASIGLVAVAATMRGRGIGSALMRAAHGWMRDRGAQEARVVTQSANVGACRLYERSGYRLSRVQPYFHFWP
jgi:ribosomal protein S18 acetylase RimI-like enzyme